MTRFELKTEEDRTAEESNNVQNIYGRGCLQRQAFPLPFFQSVALQPRRCLAKTHKDAGDAAAYPLPFLPMRRARCSGAAERRFRHRFPDRPMAARRACRFTNTECSNCKTGSRGLQPNAVKSVFRQSEAAPLHTKRGAVAVYNVCRKALYAGPSSRRLSQSVFRALYFSHADHAASSAPSVT